MAIPPIVGSPRDSKDLLNPSLSLSQNQIQSEFCVATNRPNAGSLVRQELVGMDNPVVNQLESFQANTLKGSREKPLLMKYPTEIGSAEVPHAMQFKIYWRWENKEFKDKAEKLKAESKKVLDEYVKDASVLADNPEDLFPGMFPDPQRRNEFIGPPDPNDPSQDPEVEQMLVDAMKATIRGGIESKVKNATDRVENIEYDIVNAKEKGLGATDITKSDDFLSNRFNKNLASGAAGEVNSLLNRVNLQQRDPQYDQMVSIYLPICTRINGEDAFSYTDENMAIATGALAGVNAALSGNIVQAATQAGLGILSEQVSPVKPIIASVTGLVINPRLEKIFNQKEIRNFSFSWDFYPRNQEEVDSVRNIIETFRYHSHPSRSSDMKEGDPQIMLRVPAEFTIKFLSSVGGNQGKGFVENEYIPKISRCVLTAISVDYTPNGVFTTLENNSPVAYTLTLSFSEIAQITRQDVEVGY